MDREWLLLLPQRPEIRWRQHLISRSSHKNCVLLSFVFIEKAKQRDMKRLYVLESHRAME
jgi:hypothetical protein